MVYEQRKEETRLSYHRLSNSEGENIDSGVPVDFGIEIEKTPFPGIDSVYQTSCPKFYDFVTISDYLIHLINK